MRSIVRTSGLQTVDALINYLCVVFAFFCIPALPLCLRFLATCSLRLCCAVFALLFALSLRLFVACCLRCSLIFFATLAGSLRRCTAAAQVVGLFQKQRQPQNANKRATPGRKTNANTMQNQDAKKVQKRAFRMHNNYFMQAKFL